MADIDSFNETIAGKKIIIYGAGFVATRLFYRALKDNGLASEIECFCVSKKEDDITQIYQIPLIELDELRVDNHAVVCIAVHETIKDEIVQSLEAHQINNYIWVYPHIYEMVFGVPRRNIKMNVQEILCANRNEYMIPLRYAAIENFYGKNTWGIGIYLKYLKLWNREKTANKRWERFKQMIIGWERYGYDSSKCISINGEGLILDGEHRMALAKYFGQEHIMCDVYEKKKVDIEDIYGAGAVLRKEQLVQFGFTAQEISALDEVWERILKSSECNSRKEEKQL
jgi:hypothetical protein